MKLYNPGGSRAWLNSAGRDFRKPTTAAGEICDYINSKNNGFTMYDCDYQQRIALGEIKKLLGVPGYKKTKQLLRILFNHRLIIKQRILNGSKVYYFKKPGTTLKEKDVIEASTY